MSDEKSLTKITTKYQCMVTGQKQMSPCEGCIDPKACVSSAMQYKENEEMDSESKAIVKIDADGEVMKCAKGMASGDCGYKAGAKVCGKCGAMAVESKMDEEEMMDEESMDEEEMGGKKPKMKKPMKMKADGDMPMADDDEEEDEEDEDEESVESVESDDMEEEDRRPAPRQMTGGNPTEEDDSTDQMMAMRQRMRAQRMQSMGMKTAEFDPDAYMCAFERKMHPGGASVCDNCPGGCVPEGTMPGLLEIEGLAESTYDGKVLDSGYSEKADIFLLNLERKDGRVIEARFDGTTGENLGWVMLTSDP